MPMLVPILLIPIQKHCLEEASNQSLREIIEVEVLDLKKFFRQLCRFSSVVDTQLIGTLENRQTGVFFNTPAAQKVFRKIFVSIFRKRSKN